MKTKIFLFLVTIISIILIIYTLQPEDSFDYPESFKIGILMSGDERIEKVRGLKEGLESLGFIEGINVHYIEKDAKSNVELMDEYANELEQMNLDVIVTAGAIETKFVIENQAGETPVVFLGVADAINLNFVESYQKPEGRVTGVENAHVELSAKRLQLFKLLLPQLERVIVIYDSNIEASVMSLEKVKNAANNLNVNILTVSIKDQDELKDFKDSQILQSDGILILPSYFLEGISVELAEFALTNHVPLFGVNANDVRNGFLLSYGVSYYDQGYQGSTMVSQILNGIHPSEIPVEKPDAVRLLANQATEEVLNIHFSNTGNAFVERIYIDQ